jgi:hypothetical protein
VRDRWSSGGPAEERVPTFSTGGHRFTVRQTLFSGADFYTEHLNPYLNFHRPCGVPELIEVPPKKGDRRPVRRIACQFHPAGRVGRTGNLSRRQDGLFMRRILEVRGGVPSGAGPDVLRNGPLMPS